MKKFSSFFCILSFSSSIYAGEVVSMKCSLAIEAAIQEMNRQSSNPVVQEALANIDEDDGQFICIRPNNSQIFVRLEAKGMAAEDNKLMFTINAKTYEVERTLYGR